MKNSFKKYERLCSTSAVTNLYEKGHPVYSSLLLLKWVVSPVQLKYSSCQVLLIAPKRLFRQAVERNRRKRLLRESFREQKYLLYSFLKENNLQIHLSISYTKIQEITKEQMDTALQKVFTQLIQEISSRTADIK